MLQKLEFFLKMKLQISRKNVKMDSNKTKIKHNLNYPSLVNPFVPVIILLLHATFFANHIYNCFRLLQTHPDRY